MLFKHVYDEDLAQASYLIGCQRTGEAVVVDPRRDAQFFMAMAAEQGMRITAVTETHIHADFLSGTRELAAATGAALYLSDEGVEAGWGYDFEHQPLRHGDRIVVGKVELQALHTPGHTPEHLAFVVTDGAVSQQPGYLLSGDFVFVGDLGRPDLLDEAAGGVDTRFEGARRLFASLRDRFITLPDHIQVWPGHGAGSACGKALGAVPSSTVGYERLTSWWAPFVTAGDEDGFVATLLGGQPDAPGYFGRMKRWNKAGPALLGERPPLRRFSPAEADAALADDTVLIDSRSAALHRADHVPGAYFVPDGKRFATYASYAIDPELEPRSLLLLAPDEAAAAWMRDRLSWTGIDRVVGYLSDLADLAAGPLPQLSPAELAGRPGALLLDVRGLSEFGEGAVPGAMHRNVARLAQQHDDLPQDGPLVVYCQSGSRAAVASAALRVWGFDSVAELSGSYEGWLAAQGAAAR